MIAIKYLKKGERILGDYHWVAGGDSVVEVDVDTAANLLTYPSPQFALAPSAKATATERKKLAGLMGVDVADIDAMFSGGSVPEPPATLGSVTGAARAEQLANDFNIKSLSALAAASEKKVAELVSKSGASKQEIYDWVEAAKASQPPATVEVQNNGE